MPTKLNIDSTILNAAYKIASLAKANLDLVNMGNLPVKEAFINYFSLNERGLIYQASWADYTSSTTVTIYDRLNGMIGIPANAMIDPNFDAPGQTIITVPVLQNFNNDKIPFATTDDNPQLILANYNLNYSPLYGNSPDLNVYITTDDYTGDLQTPPTLTYSTPGDETSDITQILWDYPVATTGYLQISGIGTTSTGTPTGGGVVPLTFNFTEADLLYDAGLDQYYLPLVLPGTKKPFYASDNGISLPLNYDGNTNRLNGFANNTDAQVIQISLI